MTRRRTLAAAAAVAVVAAGAVTALSTAGGGAPADGALEWHGAAQVMRVPELPRDRVLSGQVHNPSERELDLSADRVQLLDAHGRELESTARFTAGFGHGLYSPTDPPRESAELEQRRLGEIVTIAPGESAPLTLSWRLPRGGRPPVLARVDGLALPLPQDR